MTDYLIRAVSRHPVRRLARPSAVFAFALMLAYGGGFWETYLHHVEGAHERNEPGLLVHWLRDATVALPLALAAVWVSILLARAIIRRTGLERHPRLAAGVLAATVAWIQSIVIGLASPLHNTLYGGQHAGAAVSYPVHASRDALAALAINLPLAALVSAALLRTKPWAAPIVDAWRAPRSGRQRLTLQSALGFVVIVPCAVVAMNTAQAVQADAGPGQPCPSQAPVKTFDVTAMDVDIPLNRFGDHDPQGHMYVLTKDIPRVKAQEQSRHVSIGLHGNDAIQSLVIRANLGDCVSIVFHNQAGVGDVGMHIDGLAYDVNQSSGDSVGRNLDSNTKTGQTRTYTYWVPRDPEMEGGHYIHPGPGRRDAVSHGLFGSLTVEPAGSTYLDMRTGEPLESGWEAMVKPAADKAFREYNLLHHEIGNEKYDIPDGKGGTLPRVDPNTEAYRPGSRAMNYRSEPFMHRLDENVARGQHPDDSHGYGSYSFADPATPTPAGYVGDPTKIRIMHAGTEAFHVYHLHGGSIRWRLNPHSDHSYDYGETGLDKHPLKVQAASSRLDSQAIGPGEAYDLEIEGGAGGLQQGAGEFLFHCHIAKHYVAGMWAFWRVFDTKQPNIAPLPDRAALPDPVDSTALIGKTFSDGTALTADNLDKWIKPQLPPQGVRQDSQDAAVWNYQVQNTPDGPLYLGEPEDKGPWADLTNDQDRDRLAGHPGLLPGDRPVGSEDRPQILFNPTNGRPAFPLMRPHITMRPPFSPNGHSGAPYLGENAGQDKTTGADPDPWAGRKDGICPAGAPLRHFNIVGIDVNTPVTKGGGVDNQGKIFVLAKDVEKVKADPSLIQPLAIRGNIGDCIAVTLVSEMSDARAFGGHSKINLHIHHVQFDTQASDGVISGMSYEQSVRPFSAEDGQIDGDVAAGATTLKVKAPAGAVAGRLDKFRKGTWLAVGQGLETIEIRQIADVATSAAGTTVTLDKALEHAHSDNEWAGFEFVQSRWYPDVELDNIFWHDHVDGIHTWGHGLVGQLIIEPRNSTYHDPKTGAAVDSGTTVDIHTPNATIPGLVNGSFREQALWTIDENPVTDSTLNLRAAPWSERGGDPSLRFSSYAHGDPNTPMPRAYAGDPLVFRTINVGPSVDSLHIDGHRIFWENRYQGPDGKVASTPTSTIHYGVSERFTLALDGGAGGPEKRAGDYLYFNGVARRFRQGAWGLIRVLPDNRVADLQPLPDHPVSDTPGPALPTQNNARPPVPADPGQPCPVNAPDADGSAIDVSAIDLPQSKPGLRAAFVPTQQAADVKSGKQPADPLVLHVAAGECLTVRLHNERKGDRVSFHSDELSHTLDSVGVNAGFNPEQTVAPGGTRLYRFYADTRKVGGTMVSDYGGDDAKNEGLYGSINVAPAQATFTNPDSGLPTRFGTAVDVHVPGSQGYRDFTAMMSDNDPIIGGSFMPYPTSVQNQALINYKTDPRSDGPAAFSNATGGGDPKTPVFKAYGGDPTKVHFLVAPGSEQTHVFTLGGQFWSFDAELGQSQAVMNQGVAPWEEWDAEIRGGAGGLMRAVGDHFLGDSRRPFTEAGMWGLVRVMSDPNCPIKPLDGLSCNAQPSIIFDPPTLTRPGASDPGGTPPDAGAATVAASTAPSGTAAPKTTTTRAAPRIRTSRRLSLRDFARRGLKFSMTVPRSTRVVDLRLVRGSGKKAKVVLRGTVRVKRGGNVTVTWKPSASQVAKLRTGSYTLQVRVGADSRHLAAEASQVSVRLGTPRVSAADRRRQR